MPLLVGVMGVCEKPDSSGVLASGKAMAAVLESCATCITILTIYTQSSGALLIDGPGNEMMSGRISVEGKR